MALFDYTDVIGLLDNDAPINAVLSSGSAALSLTALTIMTNRDEWVTMSDSEWDDIEAQLAKTMSELMVNNAIGGNITEMMLIDLSIMKHQDPYQQSPRLLRPQPSAAGQYPTLYYQESAPAITNEYWLDIWLNAGDYQLHVPMLQATNGGIYEIGLDGVNDETISFYNAAFVKDIMTVIDLDGVLEGMNTLRLKCVGKDAASTSYYYFSHALTLKRV